MQSPEKLLNELLDNTEAMLMADRKYKQLSKRERHLEISLQHTNQEVQARTKYIDKLEYTFIALLFGMLLLVTSCLGYLIYQQLTP